MRNDLCQAILDCGSLDLNILDDTEYDFYEIVEDLRENKIPVTLGTIVQDIFDRGISELQIAIENKIEEAKRDLCHLTKEYDQYHEIMEMLTALESLDPYEDIYTYFNYLDTHIGFKYDSFAARRGNEQRADIYYKYLSKELEQIEANMGFKFER